LGDYAREDYFDDPSLSPKAVWVTQVSCFTPHRNVAIFDPSIDDIRCHMKPLHLSVIVEDQINSKILMDGGVAFNILPRCMLQRFGRNVKDLIPHNIVVSNFYRKPLDFEGVICLDISMGSRRRPTMFLVLSMQANFNMLLGREWIHKVGAVPSTVHNFFFFWNEDGKLEMVEVDQSSYEIYVAFVDESDQAMARTAPFEVKDSFYVNNKSGDEKYKFFCWDSTRGFLFINKAIEKQLLRPSKSNKIRKR